MLLYTAPGAPNPRRVSFFLAEKGVSIPTRDLNLMALEHKTNEYAKINPMLTVPALVLDDGAVLAESVAICRYIESLYPDPPLFGRDGREQAFVDMWQRRMEFGLLQPISAAFRHSHPRMAALEQPQFADYAEAQRPRAIRMMRFVNDELAQRRFIANENFTIADITAFIAMEMTKLARVEIPDDLPHLARWRAEVPARPGASA